jgi:hypothetical protein
MSARDAELAHLREMVATWVRWQDEIDVCYAMVSRRYREAYRRGIDRLIRSCLRSIAATEQLARVEARLRDLSLDMPQELM